MRNLVLGLLAASGLAVVATAPAEAVGTRHPYCIQGDEYPGLSNCTYDSYQQCAATASGRFLYCMENPYFNPGGGPRAYRGRYRAPPGYPYY
jgi:Protein of unknown function (DUF3551)